MPDRSSLRTVIDASALLIWFAIALALPLAYGVQAHFIRSGESASGALLESGTRTFASLCLLLGTAVAWAARRWAIRVLERMLAEQHAENLRFHTAIDHISQGLCFFDGQQRLIVCNRRYAEMYRLTLDQVAPGTTLALIVEHRHAAGSVPDMTPADYLAWRGTIAVSKTSSDTLTTLKDGRTFAIHHEPMPDGGWVATHEDITERRRAVAQIERMAHHDALTGLPNRVLFRARLEQAVSRSRPDQPLAVLCLDLDRFKVVNDTLGHPVGDELLRLVARRLDECVRATDLVARLGGDEFAIIQSGADQPGAATALADRLVRVIGAPFEVAGHQVTVGASIGIAVAPQDGAHPDELMKKSDLALYDAKAAGRGGFSFFRAQMDEQAQDRRALEIDLKRAAHNGELELHYQPVVAMRDREVLGFEALLRWRHPRRGMVMPDLFIPLAEETGLIDAIGEWVLNEAFTQATQWPAHIGVAVNLSPLQLKSGRLVRSVTAALQRSGLAPERVDLEITESVLLAENSINVAILHELRGLGLRISLDDFGVGFSSLSYLRSFPFKKIKIDRSFVRDVVGNKEAAAIVKAMTTLGSTLDMVITAEGVETESQFACLRGLGCDEAQGYLMSPPRPASEVPAMLRPERRLALVAAAV